MAKAATIFVWQGKDRHGQARKREFSRNASIYQDSPIFVGMIRAIIVDDEQAAINSLLTDLKWYCENEVEVLGTANNLDDGLELIRTHAPQLLFLDIEIGDENGFMLLEKIRKSKIDIGVIFTTGHSDFVLDALFDVDHQIPATDQVQPGERGIANQVLLGKNYVIAQL